MKIKIPKVDIFTQETLYSGRITTVFGKRLREARLNAGYTQKQIAELLGNKDNSTVASWELGRNHPNIKAVVKLCELYEITPNQLLGFKDNAAES